MFALLQNDKVVVLSMCFQQVCLHVGNSQLSIASVNACHSGNQVEGASWCVLTVLYFVTVEQVSVLSFSAAVGRVWRISSVFHLIPRGGGGVM